MSEKLHNAPIYLALIQAQFNPVANMVKYIADIQDQLRQKGFTLFDQRLMQKILIGMTPEKPSAEPGFVTVSTWYCTKPDKTAGFVVSDKAITFHTTHYETRKEFIPVLMMGLEMVDKVIGLDHVSRLWGCAI